jgi:hypothetical protein
MKKNIEKEEKEYNNLLLQLVDKLESMNTKVETLIILN